MTAGYCASATVLSTGKKIQMPIFSSRFVFIFYASESNAKLYKVNASFLYVKDFYATKVRLY